MIVVAPFEDPVDDWKRVPGPEEDGDLASRWQAPPEAKEGGAIRFLGCGLGDCVDGDTTRVDPRQQRIDHLTLARAFRASVGATRLLDRFARAFAEAKPAQG